MQRRRLCTLEAAYKNEKKAQFFLAPCRGTNLEEAQAYLLSSYLASTLPQQSQHRPCLYRRFSSLSR